MVLPTLGRNRRLEITLSGENTRCQGPISQAVLRLKKRARIYHHLAQLSEQQARPRKVSLRDRSV